MAQENSISINSHLVSVETLIAEHAKKLDQAKKHLQQLTIHLDQLTHTNIELSEDIHNCQKLDEELRMNEQALRLSQKRLHSILGSIDDVVWSIVPQTNQILYLNHATETVYGRPITDFLDNLNLWTEIIYPDDQQRVKESQQLLYKTGIQDIEYRILWPNQTIHWIRVRSRLIKDNQENPIRIDGLTTEITEHKQIKEQLRHDALHDNLTGLPNRTLLMDRLEQGLKRCQRDDNRRFAVLFLDLDRFKLINDSLGHLTGDQLLIVLSHRFSQCLRAEDTLSRLGGDEFVILLENLSNIDEAIAIADRIHNILKEPILLQSEEIFISVSIGIVFGGEKPVYNNPDQVAELLRDADTAMYRAKAKGPGTSEVFQPSMHTHVVKRLQVANELQKAIEREEFIVYYQPIISLESDRIDGFEALVRWQHQEKGLIAPTDFIPIAEETEAILKIDKWVLRHACTQLGLWQQQFPNIQPLTMSVNLSSKHLTKPDFIEVLDKILAETGLREKSLKLEITESFVMEQSPTVLDILDEIKQRKIELCLDDFGTGYSSLSYLDCFSFNILKIDRSFIKRLVGENDKCEMIKAIVNLAVTLNMKVVAEGVETNVQRDKLKALKCSYGQGYGLFPPLDSQTISRLLEKQNTIIDQ
ncbi:putative bifunctional diguanylate cyclase/phosphodiesterase [Crocosphaera chwakensis]|uniref:Putative diguanylate cyclase/phosphodiesterase (GGDEF & EAL domains) with PAS/PAC sensor(S) n=1 Tax=Crocosphaera chwakensis CCY0110 TaxID=391612 RepID=A3IU23_9CHRO|nr:GGDEF domain-containing phosphodiesterase [Crocosphaera chwakensis]EAZ89997.1 Putative diguanylate cyclase/phosphodiesterase (GGDEF & EAL domains) with PAS/PAC sensor(s) [Crocosphaera chwakensis CCY0110]